MVKRFEDRRGYVDEKAKSRVIHETKLHVVKQNIKHLMEQENQLIDKHMKKEKALIAANTAYKKSTTKKGTKDEKKGDVANQEE